jgi:hypothetical protein
MEKHNIFSSNSLQTTKGNVSRASAFIPRKHRFVTFCDKNCRNAILVDQQLAMADLTQVLQAELVGKRRKNG